MLSLKDQRSYFSAAEVVRMLGILKCELYGVMRPVRTKQGLLPPLFQTESPAIQKLATSWVFSQKDIVKLAAYFQVYKKYKSALSDLEEAKKKLREKKPDEV